MEYSPFVAVAVNLPFEQTETIPDWSAAAQAGHPPTAHIQLQNCIFMDHTVNDFVITFHL